MTNRNDIQYSMHVLAMTWSSTTPPLGVSDTHTCSPSSEDPHNVMTIPRFPSHPLHWRRPSITRVRNCFLAQMDVAHKPIAYPAILALHR
jgi:hypothetical protein